MHHPRHNVLHMLLLFISMPAALSYAQTAPANNAAPSSGPAPLPSTADIQSQIDARQYSAALTNILRVLDLKGPLAAPYDHVELLILRAECQLQLRQVDRAQKSLDAAIQQAHDDGFTRPNPQLVARALALSALIAQSPNLAYQPKITTGPIPPKPISLLDPALRVDAYKALFNDSRGALQKQVRFAELDDMPAIHDAAKNVAALRGMELAATGNDSESRNLAKILEARAHALLAVEVDDLMHDLAALHIPVTFSFGGGSSAAQTYTNSGPRRVPITIIRNPVHPGQAAFVPQTGPAWEAFRQRSSQISRTCLILTLELNADDSLMRLVEGLPIN